MNGTAAVNSLLSDCSRKTGKEGFILRLYFVTLCCGVLTVTLRARFRCLSRSQEAPVEVSASRGCPIRQNGMFSTTEQNQP